jgi:hypothetical protein
MTLVLIVALFASSAIAGDINDGLLAQWTFDDCTAADNSGNGHDGVINGNPQCLPGICGQALLFDGDDDVEITGNTDDFKFANESLSISAWVQIPDNDGANHRHFVYLGKDAVASGDPGIQFARDHTGEWEGRIYLQVKDGSTYAVKSDLGYNDLPKNQWLHLVGVVDYEVQECRLYIDGLQQTAATAYGSFADFNLDQGDFVARIGRHGYPEYHNSYIDEVRIYDRVLTKAEILQLYYGCPSTKCNALSFTYAGDFDYVSTPKWLSGIHDEWTIEFWYRHEGPPDPDGGHILVHFTESSGDAKDKAVNVLPDGRLAFGENYCVGCPGSGWTTPNPAPLDEWIHVAWVSHGGRFYYYLDGDLVFDQAKAGVSDWDFGHTGSFFGGGPQEAKEFGLTGSLDEIRIWDHARTEQELQETMYEPLDGTELGLAAYYNFEEGAGQIVHDRSGNGRHGQLGSTAASDDYDPTWCLGCDPICDAPPVRQVSVDIKPGSCPNPLNVKSRGGYTMSPAKRGLGTGMSAVLPVAILGEVDFDVNDIDPASVRLAGVAPWRWNTEDVATPVADGAAACECTTVGSDGFTDLTLKFPRSAIADALGSVSKGDEITLALTGRLTDGTMLEGSDCVIIRGQAPAPNFASVVRLANYPNPFNASTQISYTLIESGHVSLSVFNILGQEVTNLVNQYQEAGPHTVAWDGTDRSGKVAASGIYFYRIHAGQRSEARQMLLLK